MSHIRETYFRETSISLHKLKNALHKRCPHNHFILELRLSFVPMVHLMLWNSLQILSLSTCCDNKSFVFFIWKFCRRNIWLVTSWCRIAVTWPHSVLLDWITKWFVTVTCTKPFFNVIEIWERKIQCVSIYLSKQESIYMWIWSSWFHWASRIQPAVKQMSLYSWKFIKNSFSIYTDR